MFIYLEVYILFLLVPESWLDKIQQKQYANKPGWRGPTGIEKNVK